MRNTKRLVLTLGIAATALALAATPAAAAVANDLQVYNASEAAGTADGFVGKGTVKNRAEVWTHLQVKYSQSCVKEVGGSKTKLPTIIDINRKATVNSSAEVTYVDRKNPKNKLTGYTWTATGLTTSAPTNLCAEGGFTPDPDAPEVLLESSCAEVYLSADGGATALTSTLDGLPIVKALW